MAFNSGIIFDSNQPLSFKLISGTHREFSINSDKLDICLDMNDFETIIKDQNLFWLAYCKAAFPHQTKKMSPFFSISINGKNINFSGQAEIIKEILIFIEELRHFFVEGFESKTSFEILVVKRFDDYLIRKESACIDLKNAPFGCYEVSYHNYIEPALPKLAEFCGAIYTGTKKNQEVKYNTTKTVKAPVIQINWTKFHVYSITPKLIPELKEMSKAFYSLYQNQQLCDLNLLSSDTTLKVHAAVLYLYGGAVFQKLLTTDMKETAEQSITFADYSGSTIKAFMDFIYLGGKTFQEKAITAFNNNNNDPFDLVELLDFAHSYQQETLIDCCTNLLSLSSTKNDLATLSKLATLYDNQHLKTLCDHLTIKENDNILKV